MTNAMEALYNKWLENCKDNPKVINAFDELCKGKDSTERNKKFDTLGEAVNKEREIAFNAGFRTAVQLLMGGVQ